MDYGAFTNKMLASNKLKYSKTLAFPKAYYESIPNLGQSVVYFGDKLRTKYAFCDFQQHVFTHILLFSYFSDIIFLYICELHICFVAKNNID